MQSVTLPNGLRFAYRQAHSAVEYFGVAIDAGSRDESPGEDGLAHFVEHTIFKGTRRRKSWHIINRMEAVGGELNAYTTKEETIIYTIFPAGHITRAAELIADLITASRFPQAELDKEREVVIDEINSYLDTPSESIFDDYEDICFKGTGLGHNILGTVDTVRSFTTADCTRWVTRHYTAGRMVAFYMGSAPLDRIIAKTERYLAAIPAGGAITRPQPLHTDAPMASITRHMGNHQAHTLMGCPVAGLYSPHRHALALLTNILGGPGMNSLLNIELRERRGLVYSVDASTSLYTDCGLFTIYFGCDPDDTIKCRRIIDRTLSRLTPEAALSPRKLSAAKRQYCGQLTVASQNLEQLSLSTARAFLRGLPVKELPELIDEITQLPSADVLTAASLLNPANFSSLTLA